MSLGRSSLRRAVLGAGWVAAGLACTSPARPERELAIAPVSAAPSAEPPLYARLSDPLCDPALGCTPTAPLTLDLLSEERTRWPTRASVAPPPSAPSPEAPPRSAAAIAAAERSLSPLTTKKPIVALPVAGFEDAVVAIPSGATGPAPVVIAMHGHFDRPEQFCATWANIFQNKAFILCPRGMLAPGSPWGDKRFTFLESFSAERELDAALRALRTASFSAYVDAQKPVYVGFSLGAFVGLPLARRRANEFSSMIFVEGNLDHMSASMIEDFVGTGGRQMMLVCADGKEARHACSNQANRIVRRLEGMGGEGVVIDAGRAGHSYEGKVAKALALAIPGFVQGDPRFATLLTDASPSSVVAASAPTSAQSATVVAPATTPIDPPPPAPTPR
ncbi:MAG: hypothetical protein U0414_27695 [Polyangiaceae bacterium]